MAEEELLEELNNEQSLPLLTVNSQLNHEENLAAENTDINGDVTSSGEEPVKRNSNSELEWDSTQDYVEPFVSMENLSMPQTDCVFSSDVENRSISPLSDEENTLGDVVKSSDDPYDDCGIETKDGDTDAEENNEIVCETDEVEAGEGVGNSAEETVASNDNINQDGLNETECGMESCSSMEPSPTPDNSLLASSEIPEPSEHGSQRSLPKPQAEDVPSDKQTLKASCFKDASATPSPIVASNASSKNLEHNLGKDIGAELLESEESIQKINNVGNSERTSKIGNDNKSVEEYETTNKLTEKSDVISYKGECFEGSAAPENNEVVISSDVSSTQYYIDNDAADSLMLELEDLLSSEVELPNGLRKDAIDIQEMSEFKRVKVELEQLRTSCAEKDKELKRLQGKQKSSPSTEHESGGGDEKTCQQYEELQSLNKVNLLKIQELGTIVEQQKKELSLSKERQQSHDVAAKRTILKLQQEMASHVDQFKKKYEDTLKEKEAMVIKYAKSENEVMEQSKVKEGLERRVKETAKTVETLSQQVKQLKSDRAKLKGMLETRGSEISSLQKEVEQLKEESSSQAIKVKWAQNKLKTELDAHRETKCTLSKTVQKLSEAKEETEQIRRNCQEIIKTYQESEEMKSNSLDAELKKKQVELQVHLQEKTDRDEVHVAKARELESLKKAYADCMAELDSLQVKSKCLEDERIQNEKLMDSLKGIINSQKEENCKLNRQVEEIISLQELLEDERETIAKLGAEVTTLHSNNMDLNSDMVTMRQKEADLLRFTEKVTGKNADLHSQNITLQEKVDKQSIDLQKSSKELRELKQSKDKLSTDLTSLRQFHQEEGELLRTKVNEKSKAVEQLTIQLDDARDDNKTIKRKHTANVKDITRQLQQARKRLDTLENPENGHKDTLSIGSRTSSNGSLDTLPSGSSQGAPPALDADGHRRTESPTQPQERPGTGSHDFPGVNKAMLVDKIIRLQKTMHKKKEKMDFMQDHMNQLVEELQKKSKIIQMYVLREESGALAPVSSDINKAKMSRQSGIMASLYKSQQADPSMNLELSLEINHKLQAVLEDTLLKNITLKESIETLGNEIARITSHEMDRSRGGRTIKKAK